MKRSTTKLRARLWVQCPAWRLHFEFWLSRKPQYCGKSSSREYLPLYNGLCGHDDFLMIPHFTARASTAFKQYSSWRGALKGSNGLTQSTLRAVFNHKTSS
eukprot:jgi/Botrbrau1/10580/Bobra.0358s0003.1